MKKAGVIFIGVFDSGEKAIKEISAYYNRLRETYSDRNFHTFKEGFFSCYVVKTSKDINAIGELFGEVVFVISENGKEHADLVSKIRDSVHSNHLFHICNGSMIPRVISLNILCKDFHEIFLVAKMFIEMLCAPVFIGIDYNDIKRIFTCGDFVFYSKKFPANSKKYSFKRGLFLDKDKLAVIVYGNNHLGMMDANNVMGEIVSSINQKARLLFTALSSPNEPSDKIVVSILTRREEGLPNQVRLE